VGGVGHRGAKNEELLAAIGSGEKGEIDVAEEQVQGVTGSEIFEFGRDAVRGLWLNEDFPASRGRNALQDAEEIGGTDVGGNFAGVGVPEKGIFGACGGGEGE